MLLAHTGEQSGFLRQSVKALVTVDVARALSVAKSANVAVRRDRALLNFVEAGAKVIKDAPELILVAGALNGFYDLEMRDEATVCLLEGLAENKRLNQELLHHLKESRLFVEKIASSSERCRALCLMRSMYVRPEWASAFEEFLSGVDTLLLATWNSIDALWLQIDAGFKIADSIAASSPGLAADYIKKAGICSGSLKAIR